MIEFTCEKDALMALLRELQATIEIAEAGRPQYFKIVRNGRLVGYWNAVDGAGELMRERLSKS
jgi:hypothetical protein